MNIFNKAIKENFIIVAISTGLTMDEKSHPVMISLIESCFPSYWELLNPASYLVFYRSNLPHSHIHAEKLLTDMQQLILTDDRFAEFKVGIHEGEVLTEIDWKGRITFPPIGNAVTVAYKNQKGRTELGHQKNT